MLSSDLSSFLYVIGFCALGGALVLGVTLYLRLAGAKRRGRGNSGAVDNHTELSILFQTMRGTLDEQKSLARDFNRSVDKRVALIRKIVKHTIEQHEKLYERQRVLAKALEETREQIADIERRILEAARGRAEEKARAAAAKPKIDVAPLHIVVEPDVGDSGDGSSGDDLIEAWTGLDFVGEEPDADEFEVPDTVPESPRDPEMAREAFRALLSIEPAATANSAPLETGGGNGRGRTELLKGRVHEYHDAGMSVAQIAHELGIGKGEVRLMISLHEKTSKRGS
ncbi:MAG: hypothetical protein GWP08_18045 [Nitrospiraceae bacterium]|nr:hypothetical protein [Nitrospiraceae bacterium]